MSEINWNKKENIQLTEALLALKNKDEARRFLRDLMTEGEIGEFASRLEAARLLSSEASYSDIVDKTGLSSTTVARISKWLKGSLGGYRLVLPRLPSITPKAKSNHHTPSKLGKGLSLSSGK